MIFQLASSSCISEDCSPSMKVSTGSRSCFKKFYFLLLCILYFLLKCMCVKKSYLEKSCSLPHGCGLPVMKPFHAFRKSELPLHSSGLCGKSWADTPKPEGKDVAQGTSCSLSCNASVPSANCFLFLASAQWGFGVRTVGERTEENLNILVKI